MERLLPGNQLREIPSAGGHPKVTNRKNYRVELANARK
jgi:hypothetical protein